MLKKQGRVEQQSAMVIDEPTHPEQLLKIDKPALQDEHLVIDIGATFLQQPRLSVYLAGEHQRAGMIWYWMIPTRAAFGPLWGGG